MVKKPKDAGVSFADDLRAQNMSYVKTPIEKKIQEAKMMIEELKKPTETLKEFNMVLQRIKD